MKKHNFSAGPAILPASVIEQAANAVRELDGIGLSLIEISHRGKEFMAIMSEAQALVKEIYNLSDEYEILFLQGGASTQFMMIPYNLLDQNDTASYVDTGVWATKAIKEAKLFGNINVVASSKDKNYNYIPKNFTVDKNSKYIHITNNNTIYGTEIPDIDVFDTPLDEYGIPIIADMSSNIFSREINANKYDLIYAGAQKNMGPAGTTLVAVKKSILGKVSRQIPSMMDYNIHISNESMFNTPSCFAVYVSMLTMRWVKEQGGLKGVEAINKRKANKLYAEIDRNPLFKGTAAKEDRSRMNITFVSEQSVHEESFLNVCKDAGIVGLKGHRSVGGFRASTYNALPEESVDVLIEVMQDFERKNG